MYKDVRAAVDLCHRDGTLKQMVAKDPQRWCIGHIYLNKLINYWEDPCHYQIWTLTCIFGVRRFNILFCPSFLNLCPYCAFIHFFKLLAMLSAMVYLLRSTFYGYFVCVSFFCVSCLCVWVIVGRHCKGHVDILIVLSEHYLLKESYTKHIRKLQGFC